MTGTPDRKRAGAATSRWLLPAASGVLVFVVTALGTLVGWVAVPAAVLGWEPVVVTSGSMAPGIRPGDVVLTGGDPAEIRAGDVVTFEDPRRAGRLVTHRVESVLADGRFVTRGDANAVADPVPVDPGAVRGSGRVLVPMVATPLVWAQHGDAGPAAATVAALGAGALGAAALALGRSRLRRSRGAVAARPAARRGGLLRVTVVRRHRRRALAATTGILVLVFAGGGVAALGGSAAAFTGSTDNAPNAFDAASLAPPTGVSGSAECFLLEPRVELSWDTASHADGYEVARSTASGGPYSQVGTPSTTSFIDDTVVTSETYFYVVRSTNGGWASGDSAEVEFTTPSLCV